MAVEDCVQTAISPLYRAAVCTHATVFATDFKHGAALPCSAPLELHVPGLFWYDGSLRAGCT